MVTYSGSIPLNWADSSSTSATSSRQRKGMANGTVVQRRRGLFLYHVVALFLQLWLASAEGSDPEDVWDRHNRRSDIFTTRGSGWWRATSGRGKYWGVSTVRISLLTLSDYPIIVFAGVWFLINSQCACARGLQYSVCLSVSHTDLKKWNINVPEFLFRLIFFKKKLVIFRRYDH